MNQFSQKTIYLLLVLIAVVVLTVFVLWKGFTTRTTSPAEVEEVPTRADLNFSLLESETVKQLRLFRKIPDFEGEMRRDNPFSPYGTTTPETNSE